MKAKALIIALLFLLACRFSSQPRQVDEADFSFTLPPNWRLMSELWGNYTPEEDYKQLGAREIVSVTSAQKKGEAGVWFTVAVRDSTGGELSAELDQIYKTTVPTIPEFSISPVDVSGLPGFLVHYHRPWGEPWWEFQDYWVVKGQKVYVLSFHALKLEDYVDEMKMILDSFRWK